MDSSTPEGTPPSDAEVAFIQKVADKSGDGCVARREFEIALRTWGTYTSKRAEIESVMKKHDKSGTGKLEIEELQAYLTELNGGKSVSREEADWVLQEADYFGDGAIQQPELLMATAAWYQHVELKQSSGCCSVQ
jgi:Ca2+-binding EF-hand superfamily protein